MTVTSDNFFFSFTTKKWEFIFWMVNISDAHYRVEIKVLFEISKSIKVFLLAIIIKSSVTLAISETLLLLN